MKIWIASFIPENIENYTRTLPGADNKTIIPGPFPISDCYLTDQRTFNDSPNASSRTRTTVTLNLADLSLSSQDSHCGNTVEVDCEDGEVECNKTEDPSTLKVENFSSTGSQCTFTFKGGAGNPCAAASPHINWDVTVEVVKLSATSFSITVVSGSLVEPFPAFEMYASLNKKREMDERTLRR